MKSKEDVIIVFAEAALPVLMDAQHLLGIDYTTLVGVRGVLGALLDSLGGNKRDDVLDELRKSGVALKLREFMGRFSEFDVESIHLNIAAMMEENVCVLTAQTNAGVMVEVTSRRVEGSAPANV